MNEEQALATEALVQAAHDAYELLSELRVPDSRYRVVTALAAALVSTQAEPSEVERLRKALQMAVRQNSHDMLMTGEEIRQCDFALAPRQQESSHD